MKKHLSYFNFLVLLVMGLLVHAAVTQTIWSFITAICLVFVTLMDTFRGVSYKEIGEVRKTAIKELSFAEQLSDISDTQHQRVYIQALERRMQLIQAYRDLWRRNFADNGDVWYDRYDREKMIYSRLFVRYQEAKKRYGWE